MGHLSKELTQMGHKVDVLSARDCRVKVVGDIKFVLDTGAIARYLQQDYDIVNIHGHTPMFSDRLLLRSKLTTDNIVYTLHCVVDDYFKGINTVYNRLFNDFILRLADSVVVTSKAYYNMLKCCASKHVIPWGVDHKGFSGRKIPHNEYRVLFVGQMRGYKGITVLLRAIRGLDIELNLVGEGPERRDYERYAQKLGLDNARFWGLITDDQLRKMYLSSDVLVLPSVNMNEAFGLVTLEAAAAGCAVIASDLPGIREVVKEFGLLVKPNDADRLREAILAMNDESVRRGYVNKGFKSVKKYSWPKVAEKYIQLYEDLVSKV